MPLPMELSRFASAGRAFMARHRGAFLALAAAACMVAAWTAVRRDRPAATWHEVESQAVDIILSERGTLEPHSLIRILSTIEGSLARVPTNNTPVATGDLLFVIDEQNLEEQIEELEDQAQDETTNLSIAERRRDLLVRKYDAQRRRELAELGNARVKETNGLVRLTPSERRRHLIDIEMAGLDLDDAVAACERQQRLVEKKFASPAVLDPLLRARESAETYHRELQATLAIYDQGVPEEERIALQSAVRQAEAVVTRSRSRHDRDLAENGLKVETLQHKVDYIEKKLAKAREDRQHTEIVAHTGGVIRLRRKMSWGSGIRQPVSVGQQTWPQDVLADIVDPNDMDIVLLVHESDASAVHTGMAATVTLTAYPEEEFEGRVTRCSRLGRDRADFTTLGRTASPSRQAQFETRIAFDPRGRPVRPGMTAAVRLVHPLPGRRIVIPRTAILYREGTPHVIRKDTPHPVAIAGRVIDEGRFAVESGLETGDRIQAVSE